MTKSNSDYTGKLMYVAEDDDFSYILLKEFLNGTGFIIEHATNGEKLMEMVSKKIPDIILLDINMPIKSGIEVIKEIRAKGLKIPVIAQTAYALPEEREVILKAGCDEYISKPIFKKLMLELIEKVIK
jgi:CheY-like chemotaxis protein